jgi:glycosyltransferase involved in cell wall biosynthesis
MGKTFLVVAPAEVPVPPKNYGGTERMVHATCTYLQQAGHTVHLIAHPHSRTYGGKLFPHIPPSHAFISRVHRKLLFHTILAKALHNVDVVYNFGRIDYLEYVYRSKVPLILRFGNPIDPSVVPWVLSRRQKNLHWVGLTRNQVKHLPNASDFHIIPNTVDTDFYTYEPLPHTQEPYLLFLGRITHNKGADAAVGVAQKTGLKLILAGPVPEREPEAQTFFNTCIKPHLNARIQWIGPVDDAQKKALLTHATATLFPLQAEEAFGIVMIESMACGVPVIAFNKGPVSEIVEHQKTGFICEDIHEMCEAIQAIHTLSRPCISQKTKTLFSFKAFSQHQDLLLRNVFAS